MSFTKKKITVAFDLANGSFEGGGNTATVGDLRVTAQIVNVPGGSGTADIAIYGLPLSLMNQLSTVGTQYLKQPNNGITVLAGDDETGQSLVWSGRIVTAYVDAQAMPEVCFRVSSVPGAYQAVKPIPPTSIRGSADVTGMLSKLASTMGFQYEDAGVNVKLSNPYYWSSAWVQAHQIAKDAGIDIAIDRGTLVAVPPGKSRTGQPYLISRTTGMVGYPAFNQNQVIVRALFDPAVKYLGTVQIQSDLTPANGTWIVNRLEYILESQLPQGRWFMDIQGYLAGETTP